MIGEPRLISVAENYLRNLDLRKRQVAVKVQILNIDLLNDKTIDTSFSAQIGNTFLVSESGKAFMNFGNQKPGNSAGTGVLGNGTLYATPGSYSAGVPRVQEQAWGRFKCFPRSGSSERCVHLRWGARCCDPLPSMMQIFR